MSIWVMWRTAVRMDLEYNRLLQGLDSYAIALDGKYKHSIVL